MANPQHPLYGSIKLGKELVKSMPELESGADGGRFDFGRLPLVSVSNGAEDVVSVHQYDDGLKLYWSSLGTNTIGNQPLQVATGMNYQYDSANNEGFQWSLADNLNKTHIEAGRGIERYKVGSAAFYAKLTFSIADISATDDTHFGFRKLEAPAMIDAYTDVASLGIVTGGGSSDGLIKTCTALNNGSMTETTTGDSATNGSVEKWEVYVDADGKVTYKRNSAAMTATTAFTLDSGDFVTPFFSHLAGASTGAVTLIEFEHGRQ